MKLKIIEKFNFTVYGINKMKKLLIIYNPRFTWIKLGDQPRNLEHWITVE